MASPRTPLGQLSDSMSSSAVRRTGASPAFSTASSTKSSASRRRPRSRSSGGSAAPEDRENEDATVTMAAIMSLFAADGAGAGAPTDAAAEAANDDGVSGIRSESQADEAEEDGIESVSLSSDDDASFQFSREIGDDSASFVDEFAPSHPGHARSTVASEDDAADELDDGMHLGDLNSSAGSDSAALQRSSLSFVDDRSEGGPSVVVTSAASTIGRRTPGPASAPASALAHSLRTPAAASAAADSASSSSASSSAAKSDAPSSGGSSDSGGSAGGGPRRAARDRRTASPDQIHEFLALLREENEVDARTSDDALRPNPMALFQTTASTSSSTSSSSSSSSSSASSPGALGTTASRMHHLPNPGTAVSMASSTASVSASFDDVNGAPAHRSKTPSKSCMSTTRTHRQRSALASLMEGSARKSRVVFGSPDVAEFHRNSPVVSMTPMPKELARSVFPVGPSPEEAPTTTATTTSAPGSAVQWAVEEAESADEEDAGMELFDAEEEQEEEEAAATGTSQSVSVPAFHVFDDEAVNEENENEENENDDNDGERAVVDTATRSRGTAKHGAVRGAANASLASVTEEDGNEEDDDEEPTAMGASVLETRGATAAAPRSDPFVNARERLGIPRFDLSDAEDAAKTSAHGPSSSPSSPAPSSSTSSATSSSVSAAAPIAPLSAVQAELAAIAPLPSPAVVRHKRRTSLAARRASAVPALSIPNTTSSSSSSSSSTATTSTVTASDAGAASMTSGLAARPRRRASMAVPGRRARDGDELPPAAVSAAGPAAMSTGAPAALAPMSPVAETPISPARSLRRSPRHARATPITATAPSSSIDVDNEDDNDNEDKEEEELVVGPAGSTPAPHSRGSRGSRSRSRSRLTSSSSIRDDDDDEEEGGAVQTPTSATPATPSSAGSRTRSQSRTAAAASAAAVASSSTTAATSAIRSTKSSRSSSKAPSTSVSASSPHVSEGGRRRKSVSRTPRSPVDETSEENEDATAHTGVSQSGMFDEDVTAESCTAASVSTSASASPRSATTRHPRSPGNALAFAPRTAGIAASAVSPASSLGGSSFTGAGAGAGAGAEDWTANTADLAAALRFAGAQSQLRASSASFDDDGTMQGTMLPFGTDDTADFANDASVDGHQTATFNDLLRGPSSQRTGSRAATRAAVTPTSPAFDTTTRSRLLRSAPRATPVASETTPADESSESRSRLSRSRSRSRSRSHAHLVSENVSPAVEPSPAIEASRRRSRTSTKSSPAVSADNGVDREEDEVAEAGCSPDEDDTLGASMEFTIGAGHGLLGSAGPASSSSGDTLNVSDLNVDEPSRGVNVSRASSRDGGDVISDSDGFSDDDEGEDEDEDDSLLASGLQDSRRRSRARRGSVLPPRASVFERQGIPLTVPAPGANVRPSKFAGAPASSSSSSSSSVPEDHTIGLDSSLGALLEAEPSVHDPRAFLATPTSVSTNSDADSRAHSRAHSRKRGRSDGDSVASEGPVGEAELAAEDDVSRSGLSPSLSREAGARGPRFSLDSVLLHADDDTFERQVGLGAGGLRDLARHGSIEDALGSDLLDDSRGMEDMEVVRGTDATVNDEEGEDEDEEEEEEEEQDEEEEDEEELALRREEEQILIECGVTPGPKARSPAASRSSRRRSRGSQGRPTPAPQPSAPLIATPRSMRPSLPPSSLRSAAASLVLPPPPPSTAASRRSTALRSAAKAPTSTTAASTHEAIPPTSATPFSTAEAVRAVESASAVPSSSSSSMASPSRGRETKRARSSPATPTRTLAFAAESEETRPSSTTTATTATAAVAEVPIQSGATEPTEDAPAAAGFVAQKISLNSRLHRLRQRVGPTATAPATSAVEEHSSSSSSSSSAASSAVSSRVSTPPKTPAAVVALSPTALARTPIAADAFTPRSVRKTASRTGGRASSSSSSPPMSSSSSRAAAAIEAAVMSAAPTITSVRPILPRDGPISFAQFAAALQRPELVCSTAVSEDGQLTDPVLVTLAARAARAAAQTAGMQSTVPFLRAVRRADHAREVAARRMAVAAAVAPALHSLHWASEQLQTQARAAAEAVEAQVRILDRHNPSVFDTARRASNTLVVAAGAGAGAGRGGGRDPTSGKSSTTARDTAGAEAFLARLGESKTMLGRAVEADWLPWWKKLLVRLGGHLQGQREELRVQRSRVAGLLARAQEANGEVRAVAQTWSQEQGRLVAFRDTVGDIESQAAEIARLRSAVAATRERTLATRRRHADLAASLERARRLVAEAEVEADRASANLAPLSLLRPGGSGPYVGGSSGASTSAAGVVGLPGSDADESASFDTRSSHLPTTALEQARSLANQYAVLRSVQPWVLELPGSASSSSSSSSASPRGVAWRLSYAHGGDGSKHVLSLLVGENAGVEWSELPVEVTGFAFEAGTTATSSAVTSAASSRASGSSGPSASSRPLAASSARPTMGRSAATASTASLTPSASASASASEEALLRALCFERLHSRSASSPSSLFFAHVRRMGDLPAALDAAARQLARVESLVADLRLARHVGDVRMIESASDSAGPRVLLAVSNRVRRVKLQVTVRVDTWLDGVFRRAAPSKRSAMKTAGASTTSAGAAGSLVADVDVVIGARDEWETVVRQWVGRGSVEDFRLARAIRGLQLLVAPEMRV